MTRLKEVITSIPIIGYLIRLGSNILRLPHHLSSLRHSNEKSQQKIKALEDGLYKNNQTVLELIARIEQIEQRKK